MNHDLESQLRNALRPVEPESGFADRLAARIRRSGRDARQSHRHLWAAALAASLLAGIITLQQWEARREHKAMEARQQLIQALHLTGEKLDLAIRRVNSASRSSSPDDQGA